MVKSTPSFARREKMLRRLFKLIFANEFKQLNSCKEELRQAREVLRAEPEYDGKVLTVPVIQREFKSKEEMVSWLRGNHVDKNLYVPVILDCDDFANKLQLQALEDGFIVSMELDHKGMYQGNDKSHMVNGVKIGNMYYIIEPQTDEILYETGLD